MSKEMEVKIIFDGVLASFKKAQENLNEARELVIKAFNNELKLTAEMEEVLNDEYEKLMKIFIIKEQEINI